MNRLLAFSIIDEAKERRYENSITIKEKLILFMKDYVAFISSFVFNIICRLKSR